MSVSGLKAELKFLASIFDKNHERFRIVSWKLDELHCQFLVRPPGSAALALTLHCNITVRRRVGARPGAGARPAQRGGRTKTPAQGPGRGRPARPRMEAAQSRRPGLGRCRFAAASPRAGGGDGDPGAEGTGAEGAARAADGRPGGSLRPSGRAASAASASPRFGRSRPESPSRRAGGGGGRKGGREGGAGAAQVPERGPSASCHRLGAGGEPHARLREAGSP